MLQQSFYPTLAEDEYLVSTYDRAEVEPSIRATWPQSADILAEIDRLEESILNSPRVPLTGKTVVNEEELLDHLDTVRANLPDALKTAKEVLDYKHQIIAEAQQQAKEILDYKHQIIAEAQQQAKEIIAEANRHAYQVANESGIVDRAEIEAMQIRQMTIAECEQIRLQTTIEVERIRNHNIQELERTRQVAIRDCQQIQAGADEYADGVLSGMECQLTDLIQAIQRGRQQLHIESASAQISA